MAGGLKSVTFAATRLGVSPFTVRRLIDAGAVRAVHVGARILIPVAEIDRVVSEGAGRPRTRKARSVRSRTPSAD